MSAWHPELDVLTERLDAAAGDLLRRTRELDSHHHPDDWVIRLDGEWHTRRPGRARGSVSLGTEGFATKREALDEVLAETQRAAHCAAHLLDGGGQR